MPWPAPWCRAVACRLVGASSSSDTFAASSKNSAVHSCLQRRVSCVSCSHLPIARLVSKVDHCLSSHLQTAHPPPP